MNRRRGLGTGVHVGGAQAVSGEVEVVDDMRKESAMPRAWSTGPGVVSCDGDWWTEEFWAPAAWNSVMPLKCCTKTDRGRIRRSA
jgi:hypothetical protein